MTGIARTSKSAADLAMIGVAGGTISLVSQRFGAERYDELDLVVKQSVWLTVLICAPLVALLWTYPVELVGLISNDSEIVGHGRRTCG